MATVVYFYIIYYFISYNNYIMCLDRTAALVLLVLILLFKLIPVTQRAIFGQSNV